MDSVYGMHFGGRQGLCLLNCLRSTNALKQEKFEFLKLTAEPKVLENLKRSWKKAWKVMEFEALKRAQTLTYKHANPFELGFFLRKHSLKMV